MIAIAVGNDAQFRKFAELLGHAEWGTDSRFVRNQDRVVNRQALDGAITEVLKQASAERWIERLRAGGIPCGRINSVAQALADPHSAAWCELSTIRSPEHFVRSAFRFDSAIPRRRSAARRRPLRSTRTRCCVMNWDTPPHNSPR
jgi:crotonobetainyl-CoA:carnitine CoA-transferase CaiB-like acyl-CoA transferase